MCDERQDLVVAQLAPEEAHPRARAAAERALDIDPDLAEAHVSLATVLFDYYRERERAEEHYRRALSLDPAYAKGRQLYAEFLRDLERFDEAFEQIDEAIRLDPLSPYYRLVRGIILHMARRGDEALAIYDRLLEATPGFRIVHLYRAMALSAAGRHEEALTALDLADPDGKIPDTHAIRAVALAGVGLLDEARKQLDRLGVLGPGQALPFHEAIVRIALGEHDRAVGLLEQDVDRRTWFSRMIAVAPVLDPVREHAGFQELRRRVARPS